MEVRLLVTVAAVMEAACVVTVMEAAIVVTVALVEGVPRWRTLTRKKERTPPP